MSITSGATGLVRLAHLRATSGVSPAGRVLRSAALVVGLPAVYAAGGRRARATEQAHLERIAELEQRIEQLERRERDRQRADERKREREQAAVGPAAAISREARHLRAVQAPVPIDKHRAASHYEVLASQLACERQIVELEGRLAAVERTGDELRPVPVWLASANGVPAGSRRRV
jgi:hypothetical protein